MTNWDIALPNAAFGMIGALVGGLVIVGALVWAVQMGIKARRRQPSPPKPQEQPTRPESGPGQETREMRDPDDFSAAGDDGRRLTPHQLHNSGTTRGGKQERPRWDSRS
ncbi:DUF6479 family protein [Streptomyces sp. NPDC002131]|uniref:DUF6479 family protein n=1 Tax=Streptomyces sp. NPDC002131 TaxID=3154535 RepID=UPI00331C599E